MANPRRLPSGKWQATVYRQPGGKRVTRTHSLKVVVTRWMEETRAQMAKGTWTEPSEGRITLAEWWERWQSMRRVENATADRNESQWRVHVAPKFGDWPLAAITSWEIEAWVSDMVTGKTRIKDGKPHPVGPETVASSLRLLKLLLAEAVRHRKIGSNAAELVSAPTPPKHVDRLISRPEADRILARLSGVDHLFVSLLFDCGLRWQEAAALRGSHVDLMRRQVNVERAVPRRGEEKGPKSAAGTRSVPLTDDLVRALSAHLAGRPRDALLFTNANGKVISYTNWRRRVWVEAVRAAGLEEPLPTAHDARHAYGSWLGAAGVPEVEIASLMGHAGTRSVQRYVHATPARFDRARDAIEASKSVEAVSETR